MNLFSASTKNQFFLRPLRGKGSDAWSVLCKRFKSFERPRLQKLISDFTNLRKYNNESIVDYITRAEDIMLEGMGCEGSNIRLDGRTPSICICYLSKPDKSHKSIY